MIEIILIVLLLFWLLGGLVLPTVGGALNIILVLIIIWIILKLAGKV